jgi:hypothetical protein
MIVAATIRKELLECSLTLLVVAAVLLKPGLDNLARRGAKFTDWAETPLHQVNRKNVAATKQCINRGIRLCMHTRIAARLTLRYVQSTTCSVS